MSSGLLLGGVRIPTGGLTMRRLEGTDAYALVVAVNRSRKAVAARRRKRRMDRVEHDLSDSQWTALKLAWGGCAYCGATDRALQRDCVLAISRGGRYTLSNIAPACASCNTSKCNDEVTSWMRRKRFDERTFLLRHLEIQRMQRAATLDAIAVQGIIEPRGERPLDCCP
jgi:5-methylcytosine-specific restriction endonuclease McrA